MHRGEELHKKNLRPILKSGRTNVGIFASIAKGGRSKLALVRRRTKKERVPFRG